MRQTNIQLGKNRITENFIETLKSHFKKHDTVKISVLKSADTKKENIRLYANEILEKMGVNYTARIIGFTISLKKWRRPQR
ncbi:YhbY family RNA-binding protein [Patescibacteria group bacterium]|nr:YhbY family RNA-binding protein [Patescibacteria group bacterium]